MGLLLHCINETCTLDAMLSGANPVRVTMPERMRMAAQLLEAVAALHDAQVVWSNPNARNVIVDLGMDCYLVGFGGAMIYVDGRAETRTGSMEDGRLGLSTMVAHLLGHRLAPRSPPRPPIALPTESPRQQGPDFAIMADEPETMTDDQGTTTDDQEPMTDDQEY